VNEDFFENNRRKVKIGYKPTETQIGLTAAVEIAQGQATIVLEIIVCKLPTFWLFIFHLI